MRAGAPFFARVNQPVSVLATFMPKATVRFGIAWRRWGIAFIALPKRGPDLRTDDGKEQSKAGTGHE